ncbi:hypothetical protein WG66_003376, partial [Moniliophthora roreri]
MTPSPIVTPTIHRTSTIIGAQQCFHTSEFTVFDGSFNSIHGNQINSIGYYAFRILSPESIQFRFDTDQSTLIDSVPILMFNQLSNLALSLDLSVSHSIPATQLIMDGTRSSSIPYTNEAIIPKVVALGPELWQSRCSANAST